MFAVTDIAWSCAGIRLFHSRQLSQEMIEYVWNPEKQSFSLLQYILNMRHNAMFLERTLMLQQLYTLSKRRWPMIFAKRSVSDFLEAFNRFLERSHMLLLFWIFFLSSLINLIKKQTKMVLQMDTRTFRTPSFSSKGATVLTPALQEGVHVKLHNERQTVFVHTFSSRCISSYKSILALLLRTYSS